MRLLWLGLRHRSGRMTKPKPHCKKCQLPHYGGISCETFARWINPWFREYLERFNDVLRLHKELLSELGVIPKETKCKKKLKKKKT
jgi:hypothetical protein